MEIGIVKIVDLDSDYFTPEFIKQIKGTEDYRDLVIKEHLYTPDAILELISDPATIETLKSIQEVMSQHDCGYFRII